MDERAAAALDELKRRAVLGSLESLLTHPKGFALTTASPLQRAICRILDGRPLDELAQHPDVQAAIGDLSGVHGRPREVALLSAIRTAKSLTAACTALRMSQTCDVSALGHGEVPRVSVVSIKLDLSQVIFGHLVGNIQASPVLSRLLVADPSTDSVLVRHPSGKHVEIKVVAGSRAGSSLVARWSAGAIFDEFPRMVGADEGVINYDDARAAVIARMLPGAMCLSIGSPWAPFGPAYKLVQDRLGKPDGDVVVIKAPGWAMNPVFWTPERCDALKRTDPDVWVTDCAAEFASPEDSLFEASAVEAAIRRAPLELPPAYGHEYTAAIDPATRGNAWTLVIATREGVKRRIVLARQWKGSRVAPLSPKAVLGEIAEICRTYRIHVLLSDQWSGDAMRDLARGVGLTLVQSTMTERQRAERYLALRTRVSEGCVELPNDPYLRADLLRVRKRPTASGVSIVLPLTGDGRHCDYAPAVVLSLSQYLDDVAPPPADDVDREVQAMRARAVAKVRNRRDIYE